MPNPFDIINVGASDCALCPQCEQFRLFIIATHKSVKVGCANPNCPRFIKGWFYRRVENI